MIISHYNHAYVCMCNFCCAVSSTDIALVSAVYIILLVYGCLNSSVYSVESIYAPSLILLRSGPGQSYRILSMKLFWSWRRWTAKNSPLNCDGNWTIVKHLSKKFIKNQIMLWSNVIPCWYWQLMKVMEKNENFAIFHRLHLEIIFGSWNESAIF